MNYRHTNILVIAPYRFLPAVNGGHKAIEKLYQHIGEYARVFVVSVKSNEEAFAKGFRLVKFFRDNPLHYLNPFAYFRLRKLIKEEQITHVITEHPYMGWLAFLLQQTLRIRWVMRSHNIEAMRFKTLGKWWWKAMWAYENWVCNKANMIFFITNEDKDWAMKNYSLPEEKGTVITFGIDSKCAPPANLRREAGVLVREQYGIPSSHRILLFNGDLGYHPNAEAVQMIHAHVYPLLLQSQLAFTIFICGRNLSDYLTNEIKKTEHIFMPASWMISGNFFWLLMFLLTR